MIFVWAAAAIAAIAASLVAVRSFRPAPLPAPAPCTGPLPEASPPAGMAIFQLPTGTYEIRAALATVAGS